ncbi:MAG: efflux RND transporter periplasmic adaptor subunit [Henriciella sp.]|nr:efflux RND transporter periplasmic adaptor subunit [Henriciella sp.]
MSRPRLLIWSVIAALVFLGAVWAFWPRAIFVDVAQASIGEMEVAITEEGEARVHDLFVVSAPASGYLNRIEIDPGDCVAAGETRLADIYSPAAGSFDQRTLLQLRAAAQAARSSLRAADAEVHRQEAELEHVMADLDRMRRLASSGTISEQALERAELNSETHLTAVSAARSARDAARFDVTRAEATLIPSSAPSTDDALGVTAPVSGQVLRVLRDSEGPIAAGEPLLEIGQSSDIEIVIDVLSEDAVTISRQDRVRVRGWGGPDRWAFVDRIDPYAFTKISALGIEEQRTNVVAQLEHPASGLGHGYRVRADIIVWQADNVLRIPMSALFKTSGGWSVFVVRRGRAREQSVELGHMNGRMAEVLSGLSNGDVIIEYPSSQLKDGSKVKARPREADSSDTQIIDLGTIDDAVSFRDPCGEDLPMVERRQTLDPSRLAQMTTDQTETDEGRP